MKLVVLGLSLSSSWGNGHATTYRALLRAFAARGHSILFLERDVPWYAAHRDLTRPDFAELEFYQDREDLASRHGPAVRGADAVIVGSYVPEGADVGEWVLDEARGITAFYDIDTPITLAQLAADACPYLTTGQIPRYDVYLSFTGGPTLTRLERTLGAPRARALYCAVDPTVHLGRPVPPCWELGYLGTYSADRQPGLEARLFHAARAFPEREFVVAGPQYPAAVAWPRNVRHLEHVPPDQHAPFYSRQRFALNLTRADMARAGHAPSVRLFEAAACATPVISDPSPGLDTFFTPGAEILVAETGAEVVHLLRTTPPARARAIGEAARRRVLREHTADHRARELESHLVEARHLRIPRPAGA